MVTMTCFSMLVALMVFDLSIQDQVSGHDVPSGDSFPPGCTQGYREISGKHTMCLHDDPRIISSGVSDEDKKSIVHLHNEIRRNVEPPATDLTSLVWDDTIAAVAQKWANQCVIKHDKGRDRRVPTYGPSMGQNVAAGNAGWNSAITTWYKEVNMYIYGKDPEEYLGKNGDGKIGHYTQLVQNTTYRLGCGFAECSSTKYTRYYVCNYWAGQVRHAKPYTKGERASACPKTKQDGLCDCGGKMCLNRGTFDANTCTCSCEKLYSGSNCDKLTCPSSDSSSCWRTLKPSHCKVRGVDNKCPFMCGLCGGPNAATPPPVFVSKYNCTFQGQRASVETCQQYGDKGADTTICDSRGGKYKCDACKRYTNVKYDFCPVMCGVCDGPCDGKNCRNSGTLNRDTCECKCPSPYSGETCETLTCPSSDSSSCWRSYFPKDCKHNGVPNDCPFMCGLCGGPNAATPPPVFVSKYNCTFQGQRASVETCQQYGDKGADKTICDSRGGKKYKCDACKRYTNVKYDYCPVMCGVCDGPCDGKNCRNHGKLNRDTCECKCSSLYSGETCETLNCPSSEPSKCGKYNSKHCRVPWVANDCPFQCGKCTR